MRQVMGRLRIFSRILQSHSFPGDIAKLRSYSFPQKISRKNLTIGILALFLVLNAVDCFLTRMLIQSGAGFEGNLIWSYLEVWYKMFPAAAIGIIVAVYRPRLLLLLNVGILAVVLWNLAVWGYSA